MLKLLHRALRHLASLGVAIPLCLALHPAAHAEQDSTIAALRTAAEGGDAHAAQQLYLRYGLAGQIDQARAWAARYNELLAQAAEAGDVSAMLRLGARYMNGGDYTPQSPEQATTWFSRAAEAGDPTAAYLLGDIFARRGNPLMSARYYRQAYSLYTERAASGSDPEALYYLGFMEQSGIGTRRDTDSGLAKLTQAAEAGSPWATAQLFKTYIDGIGTRPDEAKAISYARKAADEHRDATMAYVVATAYLLGKGVPQDETLGERYLDRAVAGNIPDAIYMKANRLESAGKLAEALPYLRQAASMQQREALTRLGSLLLRGEPGLAEQDTAAALSMLEAAASRYHSPQAALILAEYYTAAGESELADSWYIAAADRGIPQAMARRGLLHLIPGSPVTWSPTDTYRWWRTGASAADPTCTLYLRLFYYLFLPLLFLLIFGLPLYLRRRYGRKTML